MICIRSKIVSLADLRSVSVFALLALGTAGCSKAPPTKDQILARASEALATERYDSAEKDFREVLRLTPTDSIALRQLGIIYHDQGQIIQAYPLLKQAAEMRPDDVDVQLKFGQTLLFLREYTQARDSAQQILDKQPANEQALLLLADSATTPDEIIESRKFVENLREKDQDRAAYLVALGALNLRQKAEARAEAEFKAALDLDPKSSGAYAALGTLYWSRNDLKAADESFKTAADLSPLRSPMRLRYLDFKIRSGAAADAKNLAEDINRRTPGFLPPRVYLMRASCAEHQDEHCVARVQDILTQDPTNYDAVLVDGGLSLAKGDVAKALRDFEYLSNTYSRNPQVRYQLALAYVLQAKTANPVDSRAAVDQAESRLNEAIKLDPHFEQAILLFAELKIRKGSPAVAIDALVPLIKEHPQTAQAHYLLATAHLALQNRDQALAIYRQMAGLFPKDPQPLLLSGVVLLTQGRPAEARRNFEKSFEIAPDNLLSVERLVDLDIAEKQYAAAIERVQKQIQKNATLAQPFAFRASIHLAQQDIPQAEADLLKAIELDAGLEPAHIVLAQIYASTNRQNLAIAMLKAFVEKNRTVATLMQLAAIHEQLKDFSSARDAYEKLLAVTGNFTPALNNLAVIYSEHLGRLDAAFDLAKKAREIAPNEPRVADTLGWILFKRGEYGNALRSLQGAAVALADNPEVQFHIGMVRYMLGDEAQARIALKAATDAKVEFTGKEEAAQRLVLLGINIVTANSTIRTQLENFLKARPNDPIAMVRLAQLQSRDGASDEAIKTYEKVVAESPLHAPAARQLTLLYGQRFNTDSKAYAVALKARQSYPDDAEIAKVLGVLTYHRELYPQSAELLREAAIKLKDDGEAYYYLGASQLRLQQWNECKIALERALSLNISPGLADKAKQVLPDCSEATRQ